MVDFSDFRWGASLELAETILESSVTLSLLNSLYVFISLLMNFAVKRVLIPSYHFDTLFFHGVNSST
jgi:hypothetical protein